MIIIIMVMTKITRMIIIILMIIMMIIIMIIMITIIIIIIKSIKFSISYHKPQFRLQWDSVCVMLVNSVGVKIVQMIKP